MPSSALKQYDNAEKNNLLFSATQQIALINFYLLVLIIMNWLMVIIFNDSNLQEYPTPHQIEMLRYAITYKTNGFII